MRERILKKITHSVGCECDFRYLAAQTEGLSGSDLRMLVKEAILSSIMDGRHAILQTDIEKGIQMVKGRSVIRNLNWL